MADKSVVRTKKYPSDAVKFALNMFSGLKTNAKTRAAYYPSALKNLQVTFIYLSN